MVECDLAKVEVAGSNPVSRSKLSLLCTLGFPLNFQSCIDCTRVADRQLDGTFEQKCLMESA